MLFGRKKTPDLWERIRVWLWPRRSFSRSFRYFGKRILRMQATPNAVALGLAIGVFAAFTPFYGFHIVLSILVAWLLSASVAAAVIGTALANPLTIPLIFSATYTLGRTIVDIGGDSGPLPIREFFDLLHEWDFDFAELSDALLQLFIGSAVLGSVAAILAYVLAFKATRRFRDRRREQLDAQMTSRFVRKTAG